MARVGEHGTHVQCAGAERDVGRQIVEPGLPLERPTLAQTNGDVVGAVGRVLGQLLDEQLAQPLVVGHGEVRIHDVVLIDGGHGHRTASAGDICAHTEVALRNLSVDGSLDLAIAQISAGRVQTGLGTVQGRLALLHVGFGLQQLYLAHGLALDDLLHTLVTAAGIGQLGLCGLQRGFGLTHGIAVGSGVDQPEHVALAHTLSGRHVALGELSADPAHHLHGRIGRQITGVLAGEDDILHHGMGHLDGQQSSGTCIGVAATLSASCQGGDQCEQEQVVGWMVHSLLVYGWLKGFVIHSVHKGRSDEEGAWELKELSAFQA